MSNSDIGDKAGLFRVYRDGLFWQLAYRCPCGCGYAGLLALEAPGEMQRIGSSQPFWQWDGNKEEPTISPSVRRHTPCRAHFNLEAGRYKMHSRGAPASPGVLTTA